MAIISANWIVTFFAIFLLQYKSVFPQGEVIDIIRRVDDKWLEGRISGTGRSGIFPASYVQVNKMPRTKYSTDDYSPCPISPISPGPQSPGRPLHSPCPRSPLSPFTPTSLSPRPEHSPLKQSSPVPCGSPASQSCSPTFTLMSKEVALRWPQSPTKTASPRSQNSHWAGAISPAAQSSASAHRTEDTPRHTDPPQVCSHCLPEELTAHPHTCSVAYCVHKNACFSVRDWFIN